MSTQESLRDTPGSSSLTWVSIALLVYALLVGVGVIGDGFKSLSGGADGAEKIFAVASNPIIGVILGIMATVLVQSSSTTTSLVVPLAGSGVLTLRQVFPITMGANIGTCITSLLAATAVIGAYQLVALQIALVHLLFNVFGVLLFLFLPRLRDLRIRSATWLGMKSQANRGWAFGYILLVFFILPGMVFGGQSMMGNREEHVVEAEMQVEQLKAVEEEIQREDMAID